MTNVQSHARRELNTLFATTPDAIIKGFENEIISLCDKFGKSGQSGGSAPYTASAITQTIGKLLMFETIAPLTGEDSEWVDVSTINDGETMYQNNRDSRVFKYSKDGKAYFIDAIVFNGDIGGGFTGNGSVVHNGRPISSSQQIKEFPFTPKTFYVDVIDHRWKDKDETQPDPNGDWWTHTLKDPRQLKEVFQYYEKIE